MVLRGGRWPTSTCTVKLGGRVRSANDAPVFRCRRPQGGGSWNTTADNRPPIEAEYAIPTDPPVKS